MKDLLKSKKAVLSVLAALAVVGLVLAGEDLETVKWVGGFLAAIAGTFNIGQGIADGMSGGETSATT